MVHYLTESHDSMYIQKWNEGAKIWNLFISIRLNILKESWVL